MKRIDTPLIVEGKGHKNKKSLKDKSFGYQVLGFGAGGSIVFTCFICASGGCSTSTDGDYRIHTFNSPGTFTVNNNALGTVDYVIIAW